MMMKQAPKEYHQRERELYDKIREASDDFSRLNKAGLDTTEAFRRLETALVEFESFRYMLGKRVSKNRKTPAIYF
ncbi:hypothetical protein [Sporomusa aerivorans]|uniref:hypothetical protein n=1 Tax=Sporomusa aerivorans TaxID=204936 RepID=UPI00352B3207